MATDQLGEYSAKRKFEATPEPAPAVRQARGGAPPFVLPQDAPRPPGHDPRRRGGGRR